LFILARLMFMTRFFSTLILLLLCIKQSSAQDTAAVRYLDKMWQETSRSNASYYRKIVRHHNLLYMYDYYMSGQLQMSGQYEDAAAQTPTDTFTFYYPNGQLKRKGYFLHGKAFGKWSGWFEDGTIDYVCTYKDQSHKCAYYHSNGIISSIEEFVNDTTLVAARLWDSTGDVSANTYLEIKPTLYGYEDGYRDFFTRALTFPEDENGNRLYGLVQFYVTIDKSGKAVWGDIVGFAHPEIALALERAVNKMPLWSPAIMHNRQTEYVLYLSFRFKDD
jgi:hypothetical protein